MKYKSSGIENGKWNYEPAKRINPMIFLQSSKASNKKKGKRLIDPGQVAQREKWKKKKRRPGLDKKLD